jgi:hypothetical protein
MHGESAGRGAIDPGEQVEEGRLPSAGRSDDGDKFARRDRQLDAGERNDGRRAGVHAADVLAADGGLGRWSGKRLPRHDGRISCRLSALRCQSSAVSGQPEQT